MGIAPLLTIPSLKILFSHDGSEEKFKEIFNLTSEEFLKVKNL